MATNIWGKVYFFDKYAGIISSEPGGRYKFEYDNTYVEARLPPISITLPLTTKPYYTENRMHPYFDNLVAEGWLATAQARALGTNINNRLALLIGFGLDCIGGITIIDPEQKGLALQDTDSETIAALSAHVSLSGVQPKMLVIQEKDGFRPVRYGEMSTHIAKFESGTLPGLIEIEYISSIAFANLMKKDAVYNTQIGTIKEINKQALIVERFDRKDRKKIHFEEFNQLLGFYSDEKYNGAYHDMASFIRTAGICIPAEVELLFRRVLAHLIIGNTDAHFKNFAMIYKGDNLVLSPSYDVVSSGLYSQFNTIALKVGDTANLDIKKLGIKHINKMAELFGLNKKSLDLIFNDFAKRIEPALQRISSQQDISKILRDNLINFIRKRWNTLKNLIGTA